MYKIRRVYRSKAGEAANLAKLVYAQAKIYRDSGHRGLFTVSYNGSTLPGDQNIDRIMSPKRACYNRPLEGIEAGSEFKPLIENPHLAFYETFGPSNGVVI